MAKNAIIYALFIALLFMSGLAYINRGAADKIEVDSLKYALKNEQANSKEIEWVLKLTRDTLELAYLVANNAKIDVTKAKIESHKWRKKYETIVFQPLTDSLRERLLSDLYHSYKDFR